MSLARSWRVLSKDLRLGPRSPLLLWAIILPVAMTLLVRGVFGGLFEQTPRLGIVDLGDSAVTREAADLEGIEVILVDDPDDLRAGVESDDLDAGLILPGGFDSAVIAGEQPPLQFYVAGGSLASNRVIVAVTTIELVRGVAGEAPPVDVEVVSLGEASLGFDMRVLPLLVMMAVAIAGVLVPASSLVQEREKRSLEALLVTPVTVGEVLLAKGTLGFVLATLTGLMTLLLNGLFDADPWALAIAVMVGALMMVEVGLVLGAWAPDMNTLFTVWKSGGIIILFPVIFYMWPTLPQWIAKLGPTYWFLEPVFRVSVEGVPLAEVWLELVIGIGICVLLLPVVAASGRALEVRLAIGGGRAKRRIEPART